MAVQGDNITAFIYEVKGEDFNVSRIDFSKNGEAHKVENDAEEAKDDADE